MIDLILDDCMNVMKKYEDNHFDLAIVDPPYGLGNKLKPRGGIFNNSFGGMGSENWDIAPDKKYFDELFRISKNQIIWGGNYFIEYLYNTRCFVAWDKMNGDNSLADFELAWTSFDKNCKRFSMHHFSKGYGKKIHPTQKPVKLYEWLLHNYAEKGQKILDTHLGSGSIAVAAHYFGVDLVGVEIDKEYYNKAKERVDELTKQTTML